MLVDWFTVAAQALNFLVLAWLLKRFLYRPVLEAIDAREAAVARQLAEAEATAAQARSQRAEYEQKLAGLQHDAAAQLAQAARAAEAERTRLLEAERATAQARAQRQQQAFTDAAQRLQQAFAERVQREAFAATRRMLGELADADLQEQMLRTFLARLRALPEAERARLRGDRPSQVRVRSGFALSGPQRQALADAVSEVAGGALPLRFETDPALLAGLELDADGWKFAWSLAQATASLEAAARELLAGTAAPDGVADAG
jgi:F-type H+-transporting ATPase subunit b